MASGEHTCSGAPAGRKAHPLRRPRLGGAGEASTPAVQVNPLNMVSTCDIAPRSSAPAQHCIHAKGGNGKHTRSSAPGRLEIGRVGGQPAQVHPLSTASMRDGKGWGGGTSAPLLAGGRGGWGMVSTPAVSTPAPLNTVSTCDIASPPAQAHLLSTASMRNGKGWGGEQVRPLSCRAGGEW